MRVLVTGGRNWDNEDNRRRSKGSRQTSGNGGIRVAYPGVGLSCRLEQIW